MAEVAIFIKTFLREKALLNCVHSIEENINNLSYRLYIADDGDISSKKEELYKKLRKEGHIVLDLPYDTGASKSRNILLEKLQEEEYVLRMDDDFEICKETNLSVMKNILDNNKKIGAVADLEKQVGDGKGVFSGQINTWQGYLEQNERLLIKRMIPLNKFKYFTTNGISYAKADFTRNMILIKRELFNKIKWENKLRFAGEHLDFLLQIKDSRWDLVFTTDSIHLHRDDIQDDSDENYYKVKKQENIKDKVFKEKWGIDKIKIERPIKNKIKAGILKLKNKLLK